MRDHEAYRLERITAARLRVMLDHRLGRPTPESDIRLSKARTPDLDAAVRRAQLAIAPPRPEDLSARWTRVLSAALPVVPVFFVIVLTAWFQVESVQLLLAGLGTAAAAGALPMGLLSGVTARGFWSSAWAPVLVALWVALMLDITYVGLPPELLVAVVATFLICWLGGIHNELRIPRFDTRGGGAVDLQPLVRYGLTAAGFGAGTVLSIVLANLPAAETRQPLVIVFVAILLTPLAYTVAIVGIQLAIALTVRRHPRFGFLPGAASTGLLVLWHLALRGATGWLVTGCVVVLAVTGVLLALIRQRASAGQMSR